MVYWFEGTAVYEIPAWYQCPYALYPVWCEDYPNCEGCPIYEGNKYYYSWAY